MAYSILLVSCSIEEGPLAYPLGALCIQSAVKRALKDTVEVSLRRYLTDTDDPKSAAKSVARGPFDAVGLSVYLYNRTWMESFAKELRRQHPALVLFAGGPEVSADDSMVDSNLVDFLIAGEGEEAAVVAVKQLIDKAAISGAGIRTKDCTTRMPAVLPVLENLPSPILNGFVAFDSYRGLLWEMTRGCPFSCAFCFEGRGSHAVRSFSLTRLQAELEMIAASAIREVFVLDPTFNLNESRTKTILSMLARLAPPDMHFTFEVRAELLDAAQADLFADLNCSLQIGLQSSNEQLCAAMGRTLRRTAFERNLALLNQRGIVFGLDLIIGLPGDDLAGFSASLDYALALMPSNLDIFVLAVLPGTALAQQAGRYGLNHLNHNPYTVLSTPTMSEGDIAQAVLLKQACDLFYTKGSAAMWFNQACAGLDLKPSQLLERFVAWTVQQGLVDEWEIHHPDKDQELQDLLAAQDPFELQDAFITDMYRQEGKRHLSGALKAYMELHQGIAYLQQTGEQPVLVLGYDPDELALLDRVPLAEFCTTHSPFSKKRRYVVSHWEDGVRFDRLQ